MVRLPEAACGDLCEAAVIMAKKYLAKHPQEALAVNAKYTMWLRKAGRYPDGISAGTQTTEKVRAR